MSPLAANKFKTTIIPIVVVTFVIGPVLAKFEVNRDVRFELHTREHSLESFEELRIDGYGRTQEDIAGQSTIFNASRPTRVFVHGYWSSRRAFLRYAKAFLNGDDCNFIAVNWLNGSKTYNYWKARGRVERVSVCVCVCDGAVWSKTIWHNNTVSNTCKLEYYRGVFV